MATIPRIVVQARFRHPIRARLYIEWRLTFGWLFPADEEHVERRLVAIAKPESRVVNGPAHLREWKRHTV